MKKRSRPLMLLGLLTSMLLGPLTVSAQTPSAVPPLMVRVPEAKEPVVLKRVDVTAQVVGAQALTRVELVLHNPNQRVLEGELQFPLLEGQSVTGFALDINGKLRAAVPVQKAKGRQVFEDVVRRNVDPALLERTRGNNFKLRIYPLPPQGDRRIALQIAEPLTVNVSGHMTYHPPLNFGDGSGETRLRLRVAGVSAASLKLGGNLHGARVSTEGKDALVDFHRQKTVGLAAQLGQVSWPASPRESISVSRFDATDYFYAEFLAPHSTAPRPAPRNLVILWDASGSGARRDHAREMAFLDAFFKKAPSHLNIALVLTRNEVAPPQTLMTINGSKWEHLRHQLQSVVYDGATNPAAWSVPPGMIREDTLALLFSDGVANWGDTPTPPSQVPLFAVNASMSADPQRLRALSEASGGRYLDLVRLSPETAATAVYEKNSRLQALYGSGIEDLVAVSESPENGRFQIAGRLIQTEGEIVLTVENANGKTVSRHVTIRKPPTEVAERMGSLMVPEASIFPGFEAQRWAQLKIASLEADRNRHRAEIRRIGQQFGLVSGETSLIVLETLNDYLRYEILPPAGDLRLEYEQQRDKRKSVQQLARIQQRSDIAKRYAERIKWWETDFPKGSIPTPAAQKPPGYAGSLTLDVAGGPIEARSAPMAPMLSRAPVASAPPAAAPKSIEAAGKAAAPSASIQLQKWQPDGPYAKRLRQASQDDVYGIYLDERPDHLNSTAFFLDAANIFLEKGLPPKMAIQALSNLAEMDLENRHILRILAYRLQQAGQVKLAIPLLKRVQELAPDEPQSWRDLGLAYAAGGQFQAAIDTLCEVINLPNQGRFADIDLIALAEINGIVARNPGLDTSAIDPDLLRNLPLDLRVVLTWDADNTDIDLWVIDPNGDKAYYGHPLTYQGGRMSRDFVAGYGPEEFALKNAKPGHYQIHAHFYGHQQQLISPYTTLMVRISTAFGIPEQQEQDVVLRLSDKGDTLYIGSVDIGTPQTPAVDPGKKSLPEPNHVPDDNAGFPIRQ